MSDDDRLLPCPFCEPRRRTMAPEQIAELEALAEKATPGPWLRSNDPKKWVSTLAPITSQEWRDNVENDAALIIALRNNLPAILAALKAQQPDEGVVERVAELQLAAFLAGRGSVKSMQYGARSAAHAPSMDDFRSMAIAAMQESR